ncbi:hypothetical protein GCM10022243_46820 [Saccharothrix violaceirubra]|uniref:Uncharacterized protein n=1 Tax=Saccharothrix violaceirubra TaxID=413306 RepID=A0A7W7T721_9PSEU|nr:hypothetical protein [Saccharothrix violaceirubra]MBB4967777.1 hypothetical protein [Saccharothrix violaceirubra]
MGSQITEGLGEAWAMVATFVPKFLGFLLVLGIGWLIAKALARGVDFLLGRLAFERLVERSGLRGAMARSPITATGLVVKAVYYFVLLIALQTAFGVFGAGNAVSALLNDVIAYLPRIVVALVLVLVASAIGKAARGLVVGALGTRPYTRALGAVTQGFIMALGVIAALNQLGIAVSVTMPVLIAVLATVAGVVVVGVGGGLIRPMQRRWEGMLDRVQEETRARPPEQRRSHDPITPSATASAMAGGRRATTMDTPTPPQGFERPKS